MKIAIYQLKDIKNVDYAFRGWTDTTKKLFNFSDYRKVYESYSGDTEPAMSDEDLLDNIFAYFNDNTRIADNFKGHSLSMSDVVAIGDIYYYCDMCGWKDITKFISKD